MVLLFDATSILEGAVADRQRPAEREPGLACEFLRLQASVLEREA